MYIVYKLTSPSGKIYVGWTGYSLKGRLAGHKSDSKRYTHKMSNAIRKYPLELWEKKILFESNDRDMSLKKEMEFIDKFDSIKNGYNILIGGNCGTSGRHYKMSDEHKLKISLSNIGKNKGKGLGYHHTKLTKLKIAMANLGKVRTPEHQQKITDAKSKTYKIVTPDNESFVIKNLRKFCRENNLQHTHMIDVAKFKVKQHKQYQCFYNEVA